MRSTNAFAFYEGFRKYNVKDFPAFGVSGINGFFCFILLEPPLVQKTFLPNTKALEQTVSPKLDSSFRFLTSGELISSLNNVSKLALLMILHLPYIACKAGI